LSESLESEIPTLRALIGSARDPERYGFAPLAEALRRQGDLEEALTQIQVGLRNWPELATAHLVAARIHRDRGDATAAQTSLDRLFELDERNVEGLRLAAALAEGRGEPATARAFLEQVLEQDGGAPDLEDLRVRRDRFLTEEDLVFTPFDDPEPKRAASTPSPATPVPPLVTRTMAELYVRQGLIEKAIEVYEQLLQRAPSHAEWRARLGELTRSLGSPAPGPEAQRTISTELNDLLAWEPGAVPIATLAPLESHLTSVEGD
jgi:tetratricopeptide (TPR) repeat protein